MPNKNSHTSALFHYTKNQNVLFSILKDGLNFSYCKENISNKYCIGIPMISFCDIPISKSSEHASKYGHYAIALSKNKLLGVYKGALEPVNYFTSLSSVEAAFKLREEGLKQKQNLQEISNISTGQEESMVFGGNIYKGKSLPLEQTGNVLQSFFDSIDFHHFSTQAIGFMKAYQSIYKGKNQINYDECEWRIVIPENASIGNNTLCKWFWTEDDYDNWRKDRNDKFVKGLSLQFSVDDIEYIIVPNKEIIPNFIKRLIKLKSICSSQIDDKTRYSLVSKVISLEQIKRDF